MAKRDDLTGKTFGRWTVIRRGADYGNGYPRWVCICECGTEKLVADSGLRYGQSLSCGCIKREQNRVIHKGKKYNATHDMSYTAEYMSWSRAKRRCFSKDAPFYDRYGGRGIRMCDEWINDFQAFYDHVGPKPSSSHTLDRIDVDGDYEPGNVRWATQFEQARNKSNNIVVPHNGLALCISEWAERLCLPEYMLRYRIKAGWDIDKAFRTPVRKRSGRP